MIFKLSVVAVLVAPLVSALTVNAPSQAVTSGGSMTFTWSVKDGDPSTFSVFLKNPTFNDVFGVANSVDATLGTITIAIPSVPVDQQYEIQLVPIDNSQQVLAQSPSFTIGAVATGTTTATTLASASTHSGATSTTRLTESSATTRVTLSSAGGFGTTISGTQVSSAATSATAPASSSGAGAAASSSPANSAALPVRFNMNMGVVASMVLSVFAGAAVVAL